jgi:membrane fusion protein (multidrug efflux system)
MSDAKEGESADREEGGRRHGGNRKRDDRKDEGRQEKRDDGPPIYKRPLFWVILILVVAVLAIGGLLWWLNARKFESTDDAFIDAHIVRIAPQASGRLIWVAEADNRHVRPGQLLAIIEPSGPRAELEQAEAGVAEAEAGIDQAQGRLIAARAQHEEAAANAAAPAAEAGRAARDYARYRHLAALDREAVAPTQIDAARAQAENTAAQAAAARRAADSAGANVLVARRQVAAARAQLRAAQARVSQSQVNLGNLRVVAPIAGQVVNRMVNVGSTVSPQAQMMAIVPDRIWVTANFKETQLALMRPGQSVDIRIDAFSGETFPGHVDSIQRGAGQAFALLPPQNASGNYVKVVQRVPVRILFDRMPDPARWPIGPGMSVTPRVRVRD